MRDHGSIRLQFLLPITPDEILADGRRSGELRDDFDARLLDIAIIGLCEFIVVGRPILDGWTARGENSDELVKKYADFVVDLVIRGIIAKKER